MVFKYISTKEIPADITSHRISVNHLFVVWSVVDARTIERVAEFN